jgi:hypothetical protein
MKNLSMKTNFVLIIIVVLLLQGGQFVFAGKEN